MNALPPAATNDCNRELMSNRAKDIIASARFGSLGTISDEGGPFVTLVAVTAVSPTSVAMLLSGLAKHTKNLDQRPDCSLLLVEPGDESGDPLAGARLTLTGTAQRLPREQDSKARDVFLARHPSASMYADFGDFAFFQIEIQQAHLVAGFGQIETIPASRL